MGRTMNPLLPPHWYIPDGEAHVFDGELYLYGSCDRTEEHFCSGEYYVAHTRNFVDWDIEGPSYTIGDAFWAGESKMHSSVHDATSFDDLPEHIRKYLPESARDIPVAQIIEAIEQQASRNLPKEKLLYAPDAAQKGGKTYLYLCVSDDTGGVAVADTPTGPFTDSSSMRKRGNTYYYVFTDTSRGKPTCLGYATGKSPLGPFTYQGIIIDNEACDPGSWNNHGSIEEIDGQWYVFYHRSSGNSQYMRRACAEPIFFDEAGLIQEVRMTSQGAGTPFSMGENIPGYCACEVSGKAYIANGSEEYALVVPEGAGEAVFRYFKNETEASLMKVSAKGTGNLKVCANGKPVGLGRLESGGIQLKLEAGIHEIRLEISDAGQASIGRICFL